MKFAKLNPSEKSTSNQFAKLNPRDFFFRIRLSFTLGSLYQLTVDMSKTYITKT